MSLALIDKPECPFCWKLRLALQESQVPHTLVDFASKAAANYIEGLPYGGTFPVLLDGDITITDSTIALSHLSETHCPDLLPTDPGDRAHARTLEHYAANEMGKSMRKIVLERRNNPKDKWDLKKIADGEAIWLEQQAVLSNWLGTAEYFVGDRFSIAECALIPRFCLAARYGSPMNERFENLANWYHSMQQRPAVNASSPW